MNTNTDDFAALLGNRIKLGHMRLILALEATGQISAAAQFLNISQPAASRMLLEIEDILGAPVCERLPRGILLTPYGRSFSRHARSILLELRAAEVELSDLRTGRGGTVAIGAVTSPAITLAVPAIKKIRAAFPNIHISVQVDTSPALTRELMASNLDFILARIPDDLEPRLFESEVIGVERACLIVRHGHPLLRHRSVRLEQLSQYDWVFQPAGTLLRRTVEAMFLQHNCPLPDKILSTPSLALTLIMVAQTDGIAPIALDAAKVFEQSGRMGEGISILPLEQTIDVKPYSLISLRDRSLSPTAQKLRAEILEQVKLQRRI